ncbi:FG-GAP-like repeat-containing protein [Janthinobacterium sp. Ant5-2-1]|uniref:FG-GAP-like repeat-containing protein n=1 Tax=Janthinobacterium sp. Ant5-2-1 TaxID=1755239 RepID=UPI0009E90A24|nr:FG-GAP-like repeat-containing protein [Janthinobacterium sp. Ant5-2-1]
MKNYIIAIIMIGFILENGESNAIVGEKHTTNKSNVLEMDSTPFVKFDVHASSGSHVTTDMFIVAHEDDDLLFLSDHIQQSIFKGNHVVTVFLSSGISNIIGDTNVSKVSQAVCAKPKGVDGHLDLTPYIDTSSLQSCYDSLIGIYRIAGILNAYEKLLNLPTLSPSEVLESWSDGGVANNSRNKGDDAVRILVTHNCAFENTKNTQNKLNTSNVFPSIHCFLKKSGEKRVDLYFMGLTNSWGWKNGYPENIPAYNDEAIPTIETLWKASLENNNLSATITSGYHFSAQRYFTYNRSDVIGFLFELMSNYKPKTLGTLDSTKTHYDMFLRDGLPIVSDPPVDHSDHIYAANFAQEADRMYTATYGIEHRLINAQTYSIRFPGVIYPDSPAYNMPNLQCSTAIIKQESYAAYMPWNFNELEADSMLLGPRCDDLYASQGEGLNAREGATVNNLSFDATKIANFNGCLTLKGHNGVFLSSCKNASAWNLDNWGQFFVDSMHCLTANPISVPFGSFSNVVTTSQCEQRPDQTWTILNNGQIRGINGLCLSAGDNGVFAQECAQLADLTIYPRDGRFNQRWVKKTGAPVMQKTQNFGLIPPVNLFADTEFNWDAKPVNYSTFRSADINGDGRADICGLRPDGIVCTTLNANGSYSSITLWSTAISSATINSSNYAMSFQLADINGDKKADACIRDANGIKCVISNGDSFSSTGEYWTEDFSDAQGWGLNSTYYDTIRLVDVNKDGYADICSRGTNGIYCGINDALGKFNPVTLWLSSFDDASGWNWPEHALTIQFADVNGDGNLDICGRGGAGVYCALGDPDNSRFIGFGLWGRGFSDANGWNQPEYYLSLRLADVDGDGKADVCARGKKGVFCELSRGNAFHDNWNIPVNTDFTDNAHFGTSAKASTLLFPDINGDGRADICGRTSQGYMCALSAVHKINAVKTTEVD